MWLNCIFRQFQTLCFQALIHSWISENSTIALFTTWTHVHNCLKNNGMAPFVVKILAATVQHAMDWDVLCIYTFNANLKIPANNEVSHNFFKHFFCWTRHMLCLQGGPYDTGCLDIHWVILQLRKIVSDNVFTLLLLLLYLSMYLIH
jgi:hypothetical protein